MSELDKMLESLVEEKPEKKLEVRKEEKRKTEVKKEAETVAELASKPEVSLSLPEEAEEVSKKEEIEEVAVLEEKPKPPSTVEVVERPAIEVPEKIEKILEELPEPEEEQLPPAKEVYVIYGDKGTGKTVTAMSFPGEVAVLSFDRKASIIKWNMFNGEKRIHVFDVTKFWDQYDQEVICSSAARTYNYLLKVLDYLDKKVKPDWIVIDGAEIFEQICEFTMRHRHGLKAYQGISNLNLWKERRILIRNIHNKCLNVAKKGIIYTTYVKYEDIVVEGELVTRKEVPRWIDVIVFETDYVLKTYMDPRDRRFFVKVVTSKNDKKLPTGKIFDVTDKKFYELISEK